MSDLGFMSNYTLSMEDMLNYGMFYRQRGLRLDLHMLMPTTNSMGDLELPKGSILHYIPDDESVYGIAPDEQIVKNVERLIQVEHAMALSELKGNPIPIKSTSPLQMARAYHKKYRKMRPLNNFFSVDGNEYTLIVENYALLPHMYRYQNNFFRTYNKWWNIQATMWRKMGELAEKSNRQQFVQIHMPRVLPTLPQLRKAERNSTRESMAVFKSPEALMVLELWKWIGSYRNSSVISLCPDKALDKVNLILIESDRWIVLNMGKLNSWIKHASGSPGEQGLAGADNGTVEPEMMQKRLLRLFMTLMECRTSAVTDTRLEQVIPEQTTGVGTTDLSIDKTEVKEEQKDPTVTKIEPVKDHTPKSVKPIKAEVSTSKGEKKVEIFKPNTVDVLPENDADISIDLDEVHRKIDEDLKSLEDVHAQYEKALSEGRTQSNSILTPAQTDLSPKVKYSEKQKSLEEGVIDRVNELAEGGLLSAGEYRRFMAVAEQYKHIPNPYDHSETLAEAIVIDKAKTIIKTDKVDNRPKIEAGPFVLDKSMLFDPIKEFNQVYINDFMKKDILGMVMNVQRAGYAITGYEIESVTDAADDYETHSVQITPVQGKPSTFKFMVPKVRDDGTFVVGKVKCRMRMQRGDIPIRKVSPSKVALTSYYSKIFVNRSEKQVNNYQGWITNKIAALGMGDGGAVTQLMLANVFDSKVHVPTIYSTMAMRFRSFTVGEYHFFFDYNARKAQFGAAAVEGVEKDGLVVIGASASALLVVDADNFIYEVDGEDLKPIGTFESILGFEDKAPLEMIELKVFAKLIPLGVVLAYKLGFSNLLSMLSAQYRIVPVGERIGLQSNEYAIRFENEAYVFNRDNRLATMILSGFLNFENFTRNYSSHSFDDKAIYLNMLESNNLGIRYLREIDQMTDMFIDPITLEILEEMKEPTTFIGLLIRAAELLQTDWAPDETDMAYMRPKGYERIPGMIYGELVRSIRAHKARGGIANARVDMHPFAVWQTVTQDSSVKLVEDSNPVNNVKEKEELTYTGEGGRSDRSMVDRTRIFHDNDLGVISEATKDSAQVAVTTYLSANPNIRTIRGITNRFDFDKDGPASLLSSSALLAPAADRDD